MKLNEALNAIKAQRIEDKANGLEKSKNKMISVDFESSYGYLSIETVDSMLIDILIIDWDAESEKYTFDRYISKIDSSSWVSHFKCEIKNVDDIENRLNRLYRNDEYRVIDTSKVNVNCIKEILIHLDPTLAFLREPESTFTKEDLKRTMEKVTNSLFKINLGYDLDQMNEKFILPILKEVFKQKPELENLKNESLVEDSSAKDYFWVNAMKHPELSKFSRLKYSKEFEQFYLS